MRQLTVISPGKLPLRVLRGFSLIISIIIRLVLLPACSKVPITPTESPKAAIIDQLCNLQLNQAFIQQTIQELEDYGFEVDTYQGDEVTVDLYSELPGHSYKVVIFRAHSGFVGSQGEVIYRTCLFTNEP